MHKNKQSKAPTTFEGVSDQRNSPLLSFPPELRNRIYIFVLAGTCDVPKAGVKGNKKGLIQGSPGLLLACKQTYAEGVKIYYNVTEFRFETPSRLLTWLSKSGAKNGHGGDMTSVVLRTRPMHFPTDSVSMGAKTFVDVVKSPVVQRAKLGPGVLKLQFEHLVNPRQGRVLGLRMPETVDELQTWTLGVDESEKEKMVRC